MTVRSVFVSSSFRFRLVSVFDRDIKAVRLLLDTKFYMPCMWVVVGGIFHYISFQRTKVRKKSHICKHIGIILLFFVKIIVIIVIRQSTSSCRIPLIHLGFVNYTLYAFVPLSYYIVFYIYPTSWISLWLLFAAFSFRFHHLQKEPPANLYLY